MEAESGLRRRLSGSEMSSLIASRVENDEPTFYLLDRIMPTSRASRQSATNNPHKQPATCRTAHRRLALFFASLSGENFPLPSQSILASHSLATLAHPGYDGFLDSSDSHNS